MSDLAEKKPRRKEIGNGFVDRLPPHSVEAEQSILACMLQDAPKVVPLCVEKFKNEEAFFDVRHQTIYKTMVELWDEQEPVDTVTLYERLKCWGMAEQVGGLTYISGLPDASPSPENAPAYIDIVSEKFRLRQMIRVCIESVGRMYAAEGYVDELLDSVEGEILRIAEGRVQTNTPDVQTLVHEAIHEIEQIHERGGLISGISTGFADIDKMIDGMHGGDMIVVAARPSIGKTSLLLNIADHVAVDTRLPVGICSMEMTGRQLVMRMLCSRSRVNSRNIRDGFLSNDDIPKLTLAGGHIGGAGLYIDDAAGMSILQIRARARRWVQQHEIKLLGVDYLQLANAGVRCDSRQDEVRIISVGIKNLAKELNIPIVVLCQLNRDIEKEKNRKPRLSDLRESGSIEQDADVVVMLHRLKKGDEEEDHRAECIPVGALIAKNRNGPSGEVGLSFLKHYTRFESVSKISDADVQQSGRQGNMPYAD